MQIISDTKPILCFHRSVLYLYVVLRDGNEERGKKKNKKQGRKSTRKRVAYIYIYIHICICIYMHTVIVRSHIQRMSLYR